MRVYNTLTRTKEEFVPRQADAVSMYVCGPTVYNHVHIGNARTFLSFDVIRRYLEWRGFDVSFVRNITDVDDKIINRANEEQVSAPEVAAKYTSAFHHAMERLGVKPPTQEPYATQTIGEMIEMVERLIEKGSAYESGGDVYFAVRSFDGYGKLSGRDVDDMRSGARVEVGDLKRDPLDFALWKSAKPGEPSWPSPWGDGRPGWHLECSVMSTGHLGETFDIHGGGVDLVFPHHENEIAQAEADTGVPFARYWLHGGMLQVNSEKMSKSLGNFMLLKDVLDTYPASTIRLFMLQTHYRSPLDYSEERLASAVTSYERIETAVRNARAVAEDPATDGATRGSTAEESALIETLAAAPEDARKRFIEAMDDDFNTAGAIAVVFDEVRMINSFADRLGGDPSIGHVGLLTAIVDTVLDLLRVLGITFAEGEDGYPIEVVDLASQLAGYAGGDTREAVDSLLASREAARTDKNWALADAVRDGLAGLGFTVEDTAQGARVIYRGQN
ncbi:MAG: cysteine--tRNA ligase [Actinomycetota bacterium]|jgi:cysteinyl-tRNA synthetase|nr:cysteine--tRNA ligase [Actinomycetota bacterium]